MNGAFCRCGARAELLTINCGEAHNENVQSGVEARCPRRCAGASVFVAVADPCDDGVIEAARRAALKRFPDRARAGSPRP